MTEPKSNGTLHQLNGCLSPNERALFGGREPESSRSNTLGNSRILTWWWTGIARSAPSSFWSLSRRGYSQRGIGVASSRRTPRRYIARWYRTAVFHPHLGRQWLKESPPRVTPALVLGQKGKRGGFFSLLIQNDPAQGGDVFIFVIGYYIIPSIPPPIEGMADSFLGISVTIASVVKIIPAIETAFSRAKRVTLVGSIMPATTISGS